MSGGSGIREFPRHRLVKRVKVKCGSWDAAAQLYTQNISRGGLFVRTLSPPESGASVEIVVTFPDGAQSTLIGEVVRVVSSEEAARTGAVAGMGLRFGQLAPSDVERLERLIDLARTSGPEDEIVLPTAPVASQPPAAVAPPPAPVASPIDLGPDLAVRPAQPARPLDVDALFGDLDGPTPSMVGPNPLQMAAAAGQVRADGSASISQVLSVESAVGYTRASEAYAQGQFAEARQIAGAAVRADPRNRELRTLYLLAYARELLAADRRQECIVQLQAVLKLDYKNQEAIAVLRSLGHG